MRWLRVFAMLAAAAGLCSAELPGFYKKISRVTWVVKDLDRPLSGWTKLGMSDVRDYRQISATGTYRGKAVSIIGRAATGHLGNLTVDMLQPAPGENAFTEFLARRGDGIFAIVHEVASIEEMTTEVARMRGLGVGVLQQLKMETRHGPITFTVFDTEPRGKYVLGLVYWPGGAPVAGTPGMISHIAFAARDAASVSAFWEKLGFPAMPVSHATPRDDSRYRGNPLSLSFDVAWQRHSQFTFEWIIPPSTPPNFYADFLKVHGEGVQHFGMPVPDLEKAIAEYEKLGYPAGQSGAWGDVGKKGSGRYSYMDTDAIGGVSAELIRAYE